MEKQKKTQLNNTGKYIFKNKSTKNDKMKIKFQIIIFLHYFFSSLEYATYDECQKAGFEKAFSDTVNILGFSCQEVIYKGKVLGYKLHIDYTNPME